MVSATVAAWPRHRMPERNDANKELAEVRKETWDDPALLTPELTIVVQGSCSGMPRYSSPAPEIPAAGAISGAARSSGVSSSVRKHPEKRT